MAAGVLQGVMLPRALSALCPPCLRRFRSVCCTGKSCLCFVGCTPCTPPAAVGRRTRLLPGHSFGFVVCCGLGLAFETNLSRTCAVCESCRQGVGFDSCTWFLSVWMGWCMCGATVCMCDAVVRCLLACCLDAALSSLVVGQLCQPVMVR